jgi:hypothetical protein
VAACVDNPLGPEQTHLPRNQLEGDLPRIALASGEADDLECVLRKIGIDDAEFTLPTGGGRVHYYVANGSDMTPPAPSADSLWSDPNVLRNYDMVLLPCEGSPNYKSPAVTQNIVDYTGAGGRVFTTHYGYVWIQGAPPFEATAVWAPDGTALADPLQADVNTLFPKGVAFEQWLKLVKASSELNESTGLNQVDIIEPRHDALTALAPAEAWLGSTLPQQSVEQLSFNTPVSAPPDSQCGRVVYSDFHVVPMAMDNGTPTFPAECRDGDALTPQERIIEFMLFDLASCIQRETDPPLPPQVVK